jgi:hypothetical protein
VRAPLDELSRLVRSELSAQGRAEWAERELRAADVRLRALEERLERSERLAAGSREKLDAVLGSARWRLAERLMRPFDRLRGRG